MTLSLKQEWPFRLFIGQEDVTFLLDSGGTFSNVDPGGYEAAAFHIPKDMPQTLRGQHVLLTSGLRTAWEGRVSQIQRSLGNKTQISCEGYGALFKDQVGSMVFVDRDLTRWQQPSYSRQIALVGAGDTVGSVQVAVDPTNNQPAVAESFDAQATSDPRGATLVEASTEGWYDAGPQNLVASVYYQLAELFPSIPSGSGQTYLPVTFAASLSSDDLLTTSETTGNLTPPASGYFTPATAYRWALLQMAVNTNVGITTKMLGTYQSFWANLAVYGNHGLQGRGSDPNGYYPSDILGWVVNQTPGLQTGTIATTDASGYILTHSAYYTPVTFDTIIADMSKAQGWHWGVWESPSPLTGTTTPRVDFLPRPPAGTFTAYCKRQDCDTLDIREDLSQQYNTAVVAYTDIAGRNGAVTVTADNPILDQAGIGSRTVVFSAGTMTAATAQIFGAEALALLNAQARIAGSANIIAPVDADGPAPAWLLKAGEDRIRIGDVPSTDAWGATNDFPISRVECSISDSGINTAIELGTGSNLVETLQARIAAATVLAQQGGV